MFEKIFEKCHFALQKYKLRDPGPQRRMLSSSKKLSTVLLKERMVKKEFFMKNIKA